MHALELIKYDGTEGTVTLATEDFESLCAYFKHWYGNLPDNAKNGRFQQTEQFRFWVNASLDVCSRGGNNE